jgi:NAD(P)-dependent dehydrogenase (short-subunit alcohol dehydrogenase family)
VGVDATSAGSFELIELDLASLASIRSRADTLLRAGEKFDIVIANAGVMATPHGRVTAGSGVWDQ